MRRVLIYGDSLTYGFDARGAYGGRFPESVRWTKVLERRVHRDWEVKVLAENGREIPETPFELDAAMQVILQETPFDLFAVMLGLNDYLSMYQPDVVEVTGRMKRFLERLRQTEELAAGNVRYLLISPPMIHTAGDDYYAKYDTTNGIFGKAYGALAEHLGIFFADAAEWKLKCGSDGVHLSEEANAVFADRMEELLHYIALQADMDAALKLPFPETGAE